MSGAQEVKIGIVGLGKMGQFHLAKLKQTSSAKAVGVFDVDRKKAQEVANQFNVAAFTDLANLIYEADAIVVATSTEFHFAIAKEALLAGTHVLVEKPLSPTAAQAEELVQLAKKNGLCLMVGHLERYRMHAFFEALGIQELGEVRFIEADRLHVQGGREEDKIDVIQDLMIHDLDLVMGLKKSDPISLFAIGLPVLTTLTDLANARLEFADGSFANVNTSRVSSEVQRKLKIFSSNQYLSLDFLNQSAVLMKKDPSGKIEKKTATITADCLALQMQEFAACIREAKRQPLVSGAEAARVLKWTEIIQTDILMRQERTVSSLRKEDSKWQPKFS